MISRNSWLFGGDYGCCSSLLLSGDPSMKAVFLESRRKKSLKGNRSNYQFLLGRVN